MLKVRLISHTPDPERTVAAAAKLCYSASGADELMDNLDTERAAAFLNMLGEFGHESPMEHVSFTFCIEGVSRALLAQITRHRIASFSVQSQRYVKSDRFEFVTPPQIEQDSEASALFAAAMDSAIASYNRLAGRLKANEVARLTAGGMAEEEAEKAAEKTAIEDARFVLPNAASTKMMLTMNARSLKNFFALRCCNRAQWEIRALAAEMLRLALSAAPSIFAAAGPGCVRGACPEGKMCCGKAAEVRKKFKEFRRAAAWEN